MSLKQIQLYQTGNNMKKNQHGFSLIEMLVVIAIIGVIAGITSDIFINIIKASNKGNVLTEVKQNGDAASNKMERILRNAEEITAIGYKRYTETFWTYIDNTNFATEETCPDGLADECAIIVKNPSSVGGYTKIQFNTGPDKECNSSPFTSADQDTTTEAGKTLCNGNIRIVSDSGSTPVDTLKNSANDINSATIGQLITNTELRSGVNLRKTGTTPLVTVKSSSGKPPLILIRFSLEQGINASSRSDSLATVPFELTISLRSY